MEIRLAPEYECQPTWVIDGDMVDTIDPSELPIPAALAEQIKAWGARYEATYNRDDPGSSGFSSAAEQARFAREGRQLWQALRFAGFPSVITAPRLLHPRSATLHREAHMPPAKDASVRR